jgi:hypothetical protein
LEGKCGIMLILMEISRIPMQEVALLEGFR